MTVDMDRVEMTGDMAKLPYLHLLMAALAALTLLHRTRMERTLHMAMILLSLPRQAILVALDHIHHMVHNQVGMVLMLLEIIGVVVEVVHLVVAMVVVRDIQVVVMVEKLQHLLMHL